MYIDPENKCDLLGNQQPKNTYPSSIPNISIFDEEYPDYTTVPIIPLRSNVAFLEEADLPYRKPLRVRADAAALPTPEPPLPPDLEDKLALYNVIEPTLTNQQRLKLLELLQKYHHTFAKDEYDLGKCTLEPHHIDTGNSKPISCTPHKMSMHARQDLKKELDEMLKIGVITESSGPWAAPIVMVRKKDGTWRLCIDYRKLNQVARTTAFPLPRIADILSVLHEKKYFSSLDLVKGFWQIPLDEESQEKTSFVTFFGQYKFTRLPFGLATAPGAFQQRVAKALGPLNWVEAIVYIDDILIYSKDFETHLHTLEQVFRRLNQVNMKAKLKKCEWARSELLYLGHVINRQGITVDPDKVRAVQNFPPPRCVLDIETFLGKVNYYSKFIYKFSARSKPLYDFKKKKFGRDTWQLTEAELQAFEDLKKALCTAPVLRHPVHNKPFILSTDASGYAFGAVLSQLFEDGEHPIAYASKMLNSAETRYHVIEREASAIGWAIFHFEEYLDGVPFVVYSDHKPLESFPYKTFNNQKVENLIHQLSHFRFIVCYRQGKDNANADTLSRYPTIPMKSHRSRLIQTAESQINNFDPLGEHLIPKSQVAREKKTEPCRANQLQLSVEADQQLLEDLLANISETQDQDELYHAIFQYLHSGQLPTDPKLKDEILRTHDLYLIGDQNELRRNNGGKIVLCIPEPLQEYVFFKSHQSPTAGHLGQIKTVKRAQDQFWWPRMQQYLREQVSKCPLCIAHKAPNRPNREPLGAREIPSDVWRRIHMDVWSPGIPGRGGYNTLIGFIDAFSKYFVGVPATNHRAQTIAAAVTNHLAAPYGLPFELVSDGAPEFTGHLQRDLLQQFGVTRVIVSPYIPQANGQIERMFRTIRPMLSIIAMRQPRQWHKYLPYVAHAYNTSYQASIKNTPFFLMFGRDPDPMVVEPGDLEDTNFITLRERLQILAESREIVRQELHATRERSQEIYDRRARPYDYQINDVVMAKAQKTPPEAIRKLYPKYVGPYRIKSKQHGVLGLVPLLRPNIKPKPLHSDNCRPCLEDTPLDLSYQELLLPFVLPHPGDPNLDAEDNE